MITNRYIIENFNSQHVGATGKELSLQMEEVVLASSIATDINSLFEAGEKVWALPLYPVTVGNDGKIDLDFSSPPDLATAVFIVGKQSSLKAISNA